jgi:hypothetical protein
LGITIDCVGFAVAYALNAAEVFKAVKLIAPASQEKSGASSALSQFGGFAAMAGIAIPADANKEIVLASLDTRNFLKKSSKTKIFCPIYLVIIGMSNLVQ